MLLLTSSKLKFNGKNPLLKGSAILPLWECLLSPSKKQFLNTIKKRFLTELVPGKFHERIVKVNARFQNAFNVVKNAQLAVTNSNKYLDFDSIRGRLRIRDVYLPKRELKFNHWG